GRRRLLVTPLVALLALRRDDHAVDGNGAGICGSRQSHEELGRGLFLPRWTRAAGRPRDDKREGSGDRYLAERADARRSDEGEPAAARHGASALVVDAEQLGRAVIKQALADAGVGMESGQRIGVNDADRNAARSFLTASNGNWKAA